MKSIKAMFGCCKTFSGKYIFSGNANFQKRKIFLCVWLYFKKFSGKYFLVFGKEEGKHKSRKTQATTQKKTSTTIGDRDLRSRSWIAISIRRDLAIEIATPSIVINGEIAISPSDASPLACARALSLSLSLSLSHFLEML